MKTIDINIQYAFCSMDELSQEDRQLVEKAIEATQNSYAPYSHFYVGAALRLDTGDIVIGANQENASFPAGCCAERSAIFAAQSHRPQNAICAIAIAARNENGLLHKPVTPCGICRQVMLEMESRYGRPLRVLLYGLDGIYVIQSVKDLVPLSFVGEDLNG